jgi:hypothetical protein
MMYVKWGKHAQRILVKKPLEEWLLGRPRRRQKDNMDLRRRVCEAGGSGSCPVVAFDM